MTDKKSVVKRVRAAHAEYDQLKREGAQQQKADDKYLGRVRDAFGESKQLKRDVDQAFRPGQIKTEQDLRFAGHAAIMSFLNELKLLDIREQNYQRALGELRDIETSAKQAMNRVE